MQLKIWVFSVISPADYPAQVETNLFNEIIFWESEGNTHNSRMTSTFQEANFTEAS